MTILLLIAGLVLLVVGGELLVRYSGVPGSGGGALEGDGE